MEAITDIDVLICGAGAAGLTLAIDLARRSVAFRLIDKLAAPFGGSRGKGIQPRTLEVFEDLSVVDRLFALGGPYPIVREYRADGSTTDTEITEPTVPSSAVPYPAPLMVPQFTTERVLRERLSELGHRAEFGCTLVGIAQDADSVTARIDGPNGEERFRSRYLVGTDGGGSFVRKALEIGFPGKTLDVRAIVADVTMTGLDRTAWHRFNKATPGAQILVCPLAGTDVMQLQAPIPLEGNPDLSAAGLTRLLAERTQRSDLAVHTVSWASAYSMNARLADRYRLGNCFLAGDAAHIHPPTGGQGLNTSVQDAYNLGWKLAAVLRGAPIALLDTYEEERRPVAAEMLGLSSRLLEGHKQGEMRRDRATRQLDIGYPGSSLSLASAGQRAPDARLRGAAGQSRRVFELLKGAHWTLFAYDADTVAARHGLHVHAIGADRELVDVDGGFRTAYTVAIDDRVLVRPDGYVAAITANDVDLARYFDKVGL